MCTSMPQSSSDAPCRKPTEKSETQRFMLFSRILFFFLASLYASYLFSWILPLPLHLGFHFFIFCLFTPSLLTFLFQLYLTKIRFGIIFLSKQYSGLSTLSLMTCFIILLTIFYYTSAVLLKSIRKIITFLCLSSKLA